MQATIIYIYIYPCRRILRATAATTTKANKRDFLNKLLNLLLRWMAGWLADCLSVLLALCLPAEIVVTSRGEFVCMSLCLFVWVYLIDTNHVFGLFLLFWVTLPANRARCGSPLTRWWMSLDDLNVLASSLACLVTFSWATDAKLVQNLVC